jgi:hypothetical protein
MTFSSGCPSKAETCTAGGIVTKCIGEGVTYVKDADSESCKGTFWQRLYAMARSCVWVNICFITNICLIKRVPVSVSIAQWCILSEPQIIHSVYHVVS